jgi:signal transduction histidine kinase
VLGAVAGLGCVAATASVVLILESADERAPVVRAVLVGWITLSFVFCGLIAWWQRPDSRFGPLMVAAGFAPFLSTLSTASGEIPYTIGEICRRLPVAVFLHVFLSYPTGRLHGRLERVVVTSSYVLVLGAGVVSVLFGGGTSHTPLEIADRAAAAEAVSRVAGAAVFVLMATAIVSFALRWRASGPMLRKTGNVVLGTFLVALATLAVGGLFAAQSGSAAPVRWVTFGLLALAPIALASRLVGAHLARSAIGDLVLELRAEPAPTDLQDALGRALGDSSLQLAYWLPEFRTYVDLDGTPVVLTEEDGCAITPIDRNGEHVGALIHDATLEDEPELLEAVTAAAEIAIENTRLHAELRARLEELRGSRARVLAVGQSERQRLERNLHDGAQQRLIALSLELSLLGERLGGDPDAQERLASAREEIAASLEELREVSHGLHPAVVSAHGLEVALEQLAARAAVPVRLTVSVGARLPEDLEVAAYYLVSETLANVAKHADASSASIDVTRAGRSGDVVVEVVDDGAGGANELSGSGLRGLADRVEALGGTLRVWSPVGGGTRVRAEIPCAP